MNDSHCPIFSNSEAEKVLGLSQRSLEGYRLRGRGPPYYRLGARTVRYGVEEHLG